MNHVEQIGLESGKSDQCSESVEVLDILAHASGRGAAVELAQPSARQAAGRAKSFVEKGLRVRCVLGVANRNLKRVPPGGIPRRTANGLLVEQEPSLGHSNWNDANMRRQGT